MKRLCILLTLILGACANEPENSKPSPPKTTGPQLVGRIASFPADKKFVLIQSYGRWNIQSGTILTTRGDNDRSANLLVTGESLGQFAAADVQSGQVKIGDAVYSRHTPAPTPSNPLPATPTEPVENQPEMPSFHSF